jgi:hypothetical protein
MTSRLAPIDVESIKGPNELVSQDRGRCRVEESETC